MTPENWQRVKPILAAALELDSASRTAFLQQACADASLRQEIESLIASHERAGTNVLDASPTPSSMESAVNARFMLGKGTRLGDFEILSLLGAGGMGEVYRARDRRLERDVAIKVLPRFVSLDPERLRRFEQEAKAAAALNHPNILAVFQMGSYEGAPYLVSELLEGDTLREQVKRGPMAPKKAIDYAVQIAHGLAAAHEKGIVHRDLKPENLFVTKDGRIKILDFGLAKLLHAEAETQLTKQTLDTQPGAVMGTVGYMSPEQVRGLAADHRADIFAFGAILYEMLTGRRAFSKSTTADTMSAILNEDPPPVSQATLNVPPALNRAVHRCLEKSPEQRFQSASDLAFALEVSSDIHGASSTTTQISHSKKIRSVALTVTVVAILAVISVLWWGTRPIVPVVTAVAQLTDDGIPKRGQLVTDGNRIYFGEGATGGWKIAQVGVMGGQAGVVSTRISDPRIMAIAPDGSSLLALGGGFVSPEHPLWMIPLPAGEPRRLGDIRARGANFFPDGRIVFSLGPELHVAESDGSNARKLVAAPDNVSCPNVSPDGKLIAFKARFAGNFWSSLAEVAIDGGGLNQIVKAAQDAPLSCAEWTPNGKYLLYDAGNSNRQDIWVLPMQSWFFRRNRQSLQLTNGPLAYSAAVPSRDGKRVFAIGTKRRGELIRYDTKIRQFLPFLSGISAIDPVFSQDGKWVAYISYPDHSVWRCRIDGTEALQLTYPPVEAVYPSISPDGKQVSFGTDRFEQYVVSMNGGSLRKIAERASPAACWSPDGNSLLLSVRAASTPGGKVIFELQTLDLRDEKTSVVPSSQGMTGCWWAANGILVSETLDGTKLLAFDFKTEKWTELVSGMIVDYAVSLDSKFVYYTAGGAEPRAMRVGLADRKVEEITSLGRLRQVVDPVGGFTQISVAPDGSPVFTRDIGTEEIYALDIKWP